jgi:3-oxoacyl-[acyl-carrier protein] reductase
MNILVTGCSRGVGLKICEVLLQQGHTVYGIARSYTPEFKAMENVFAGRVFFKSIDLSSSDNVRETIFKEFITNKVQLDGYVNNAAMAYDDIITNLNVERLKEMYAVNVFTPMMITKYAIRHMLLHKNKGSIVHISSISAHTGYKGLAMYASSKGALEAFSKDAAREWGAMGIRSNVVVPGLPLTYSEAQLWVAMGNNLLCINHAAAIGIVKFWPSAIWDSRHGCANSGYLNHYHLSKAHSNHIWYYGD